MKQTALLLVILYLGSLFLLVVLPPIFNCTTEFLVRAECTQGGKYVSPLIEGILPLLDVVVMLLSVFALPLAALVGSVLLFQLVTKKETPKEASPANSPSWMLRYFSLAAVIMLCLYLFLALFSV